MALNGCSGAGVRIQRGGTAVVTGNGQARIDGIQLVHRTAGVAAVKDIAADGVRAGGFEVIQIDRRPGDFRRNGRCARQGVIAGEVQRVGAAIQLQPAQIDGHGGAAERDIGDRHGTGANDHAVFQY